MYTYFFLFQLWVTYQICVLKRTRQNKCVAFFYHVSSISGPCSLRYCWKLVYKELQKLKILDSSWYVKLKGSQIILLLLHLHKMFKNSTALLFKTIGEKSF